MAGMLLAIIYLSFISLGLPDSVLGAGWPSMYREFGVPLSYAGIISMCISACTVISSLASDRLTRRFGVGKVTAVSVGMTAAALFGFSVSHSFWLLCLWAIPYGLGAGSVDSGLNNYVAIHYASRHMSWLHCMWGLGASAGPYIMGFALTGGQRWNMGYRYVSIVQMALTAVLFLTLPLWNAHRSAAQTDGAQRSQPIPLRQVVRIPGVKAAMASFFAYCAVEQTAMLWGSTYLTLHKGVAAETAAFFGSLCCIGITVGRGVSGFLCIRFTDRQMIRMGQAIAAAGVLAMLLPLGKTAALGGLLLIGLGLAPIYPCLVHSTPEHFGAERSQAVLGVQMASAYVGICLMPPLFGLIAAHVSAALLPVCLFAGLALMVTAHETLLKRTGPAGGSAPSTPATFSDSPRAAADAAVARLDAPAGAVKKVDENFYQPSNFI